MNSMEMVEQNVRTASEYGVGCMTESDRALVEAVRQEITKHVKVGCTGCGYCMPCPRGVDIPGTFRCYNAMYSEGKKSGRRDYLQCTAFRKNPASASQCVGCGKCEQHCPQHIEIRRELKAAAGELETVKYKFMKDGNRRAEALVKRYDRNKFYLVNRKSVCYTTVQIQMRGGLCYENEVWY